jgi:hypothetical protein
VPAGVPLVQGEHTQAPRLPLTSLLPQ